MGFIEIVLIHKKKKLIFSIKAGEAYKEKTGAGVEPDPAQC